MIQQSQGGIGAADMIREREDRNYLPTPAEIEAKCVEFQNKWSSAERARRMRCSGPIAGCLPDDAKPTMTPGIDRALLLDAVDEDSSVTLVHHAAIRGVAAAIHARGRRRRA
jgi:hypothetical protein